jgi:hypothetical protein
MLTGRDPAIRGLPKCSSVRGSGYACSGADHRHSLPVQYESSSHRFDGQGKYIADTTFGLNDARYTWISFQLASEPKDLHIYAAVEHVFVNPCRLQEVLSGERPLWRIEERDQECVFPPSSMRSGRRRRSSGVAHDDRVANRQTGSGLARTLVERQCGPSPAGAAQHVCALVVREDRMA